LVEDPVEQATIRRARLLWDQGRAIKDIIRILAVEGHRNRAGGPIRYQSICKWVGKARTESVSKRTRTALAQRKARGERLGNPDIRKAAPLGVLAIVKKTRERAERILPYIDYFISQGYNSYRQIADLLNANDVPAPRGNRWHAPSIRNVMLAAGRRWVSAPVNGEDFAAPQPQPATALPFPDLRRPDRAERTRIASKYNLAAATVRRHSKAVRLGPDILAFHERGVPNDRIGHILGIHVHTVETVLARFITGPASAPAPGGAQDEGFQDDSGDEKTAELSRRIIDLRRQGLSGRAIASELNVDIHKVYKIIGAAKRRDPRLALQRGRASDAEIAAILSLRRRHASVAVISRAVGVPKPTVRRVIGALTRENPELALTKGISSAQLVEIRALLDRGVPLAEIAERLGRLPQSIEQALARAARAKRDGR
jgi:DNA invertase Pin-like site-specific DNA recombinase